MVKQRSQGKKNKAVIDFESDGDDVVDEVDAFHREDRHIAEGAIRKKKQKVVEEVLNVEGDASSSEGGEEEEDSSDFSDNEKETSGGRLPSKDSWGKRRRDFYNTGYVDNDFTGVASSDEEDLAKLEEEDAIERQKALDTSGGAAALKDVWDEEEEEAVEKKKKEEEGHMHAKQGVVAERKWTLRNAKQENERMLEIKDELQQRRDIHSVVVAPLLDLLPSLATDSALRRQLLLVSDVYSSYLLNLTLFLHMKTTSFAKKQLHESAVDEHPLLAEVDRLKKMLAKVDAFLEKNSDALNALVAEVDKGKPLGAVLKEDSIQGLSTRRPAPVDASGEGMGEGEEGAEGEEDEDGKRGVSYAIQKNKQMNAKKKRAPAHSRAAKRKQFSKALVRRRSQVPDVRREDHRYTGEARGIRVGTVKSTKLVA